MCVYVRIGCGCDCLFGYCASYDGHQRYCNVMGSSFDSCLEYAPYIVVPTAELRGHIFRNENDYGNCNSFIRCFFYVKIQK